MCGKCGMTMGKVGCVSMVAGVVSTILAVACRLVGMAPMSLGPRSFAAGAALMLLLSIAAHTCQSACFNEAQKDHSH